MSTNRLNEAVEWSKSVKNKAPEKPDPPTGIDWKTHIFIIVILLLFVGFSVLYWYKRHPRTEMVVDTPVDISPMDAIRGSG